MKKLHPLCRPARGTGRPDGVDYIDNEPLRLGEDGKWRPDNGRPARAFLGKLGADTHAFVAECSCPYTNGCTLGVALTKADDLGIAATMVTRRAPITPRAAERAMKRKVKKNKAKNPRKKRRTKES